MVTWSVTWWKQIATASNLIDTALKYIYIPIFVFFMSVLFFQDQCIRNKKNLLQELHHSFATIPLSYLHANGEHTKNWNLFSLGSVAVLELFFSYKFLQIFNILKWFWKNKWGCCRKDLCRFHPLPTCCCVFSTSYFMKYMYMYFINL